MKHQDIKTLISAYREGELNVEERRLVEEHLAGCAECRTEFEELKQLEEVLNKMQLKKPSPEIWDVYWSSVYNKLERKIGWIILSIGMILLIAFGVYQSIKDLVQDPATPLIVTIGIFAFIGGGIILFVSVLKEQLFFWKKERYKEIKK